MSTSASRVVPSDLGAEVDEWMAEDPDPGTRAELAALLEAGDEAGLRDRFEHPLSFGTAGLRGPIGAGPARMNRVVVRKTTAGLAQFIHDEPGQIAPSLVVGHDARHRSADFADDAARVAAAGGVRALRFRTALPTPVTAFAVRHLGAAAGVMVTASHNPAPDNGYKVYLGDGAQVIPPYDAEIAARAATAPVPNEAALSLDFADLLCDIDEAELLAAYRRRGPCRSRPCWASPPPHSVQPPARGRRCRPAPAPGGGGVRPASPGGRAGRSRPGLPDGAVPQPGGARRARPRPGRR